METSELIYRYFEKELSADEEKKLFSEMAYNDSLREEFNSALIIESNLKNTQAYYPEQSQVNNIFMSLGYSLPISVQNVSFTDRIIGKLANKTLIQNLLYTILGAVASFIAVKTMSSSNENRIDAMPIKTKQDIPISSNIAINQKIDTIVKKVYDKTNKIAKNETKQSYIIENINSEQQIYNLNKSQLSDISIEKTNFVNTNNTLGLPAINLDLGISNSIIENFSIEAIYSNYINFKKVNVNSGNNSIFNNTGLAIYYDLSEKFKIGAEMRLEKFDFKYSGVYDVNYQYDIKQQSEILTFGANLRYYPFDFDYIKPYAQMQLGGNKYGFISRAGIGAEIPLVYNFSFLTNIDLSYFIYKHQNISFSNFKSGIYAILKYNF